LKDPRRLEDARSLAAPRFPAADGQFDFDALARQDTLYPDLPAAGAGLAETIDGIKSVDLDDHPPRSFHARSMPQASHFRHLRRVTASRNH